MENTAYNEAKTFTEILSTYFEENEIDQYLKNVLSKLKSEEDYIAETNDKVDQRGIENPEFLNSRREQIHSILTKIEEKLDDFKMIDMLLNIGKNSISLGEYNLAIYIYELIISKVDENSRFNNYLANSYLGISEAYFKQAYWEESLENMDKAIKLFNKERDIDGLIKCENLLGALYGEKGDLTNAEHHFKVALEYLNSRNDKYMTGMIECNLGIINYANQNFDAALTYFYRALTFFQQINDFGRIAELRYNIALLLIHQEKFEESLKELDESINAAVKAEKLSHLGKSYLGKANMYVSMDKYPLAIAYADKAMDISYRINDRLSVADIYKVKGVIHRKMKNKELSENYLLTSLRLNGELENKFNFAETSFELGLLYKDFDMPEESKQYLLNALNYNKMIGAKTNIEKFELILNKLN